MNNNINYLVLYAAHFINDFSLEQYYKLKNELPDGYDIVWWLDDNCKDKKPKDIHFMEVPHNTIKPLPLENTCFVNPMKYMEILYNNKNEWFIKYDFYWIVEYDVYFSGNWKTFFNTVDKYNEDLIGSAFTIYNNHTLPVSFNNKISFNEFDYKVKSYISIYRISNKALKYISNYDYIDLNNENDIRNYLYEVYIPTILYNNGYTILSLNSEQFIREAGNYQYNYDINPANYYLDTGFIDDAVSTFWYNAIFNNINQMNKPNKLYTRYKQ